MSSKAYSSAEYSEVVTNYPECLADSLNIAHTIQQRILDLTREHGKTVYGSLAGNSDSLVDGENVVYESVEMFHPTHRMLNFKLSITDEEADPNDVQFMVQFIESIENIQGKLKRGEDISPEELMSLEPGVMDLM